MVRAQSLPGVEGTEGRGRAAKAPGTAQCPDLKHEGDSAQQMDDQIKAQQVARLPRLFSQDRVCPGLLTSVSHGGAPCMTMPQSLGSPTCLSYVSQTESRTHMHKLPQPSSTSGSQGWQRASAWSTGLVPHGGPYQVPKHSKARDTEEGVTVQGTERGLGGSSGSLEAPRGWEAFQAEAKA